MMSIGFKNVVLCLSVSALSVTACSKDPPLGPPRSTESQPLKRCMREMGPAVSPAATLAPELCPSDPLPGGMPFKRIKLAVRETGSRLTAELAVVHAEAERGLMYRRHRLDDGHGMLFDLERRVQTFWMHNTCIPLDIVFVDEDGFIQAILEEVPTLNDAPRSCGCEGRYVLEVDAGWSRRHGLKPGMHLDIGIAESVSSKNPP